MAKKIGGQDKWIISTSVVLTLLCASYFLFLFPRDATTLFQIYLNYLIAILIVVLAITLTVMLYRKQGKNHSSSISEEAEKTEKIVAQIIWRNRYVLQSKKSHLLYEPSLDNREKWDEIKKAFAEEYIYLTIPESKVSVRKVSELIEKSLQGASIGSIKPPTYSVKNISK
jgi:uncharacterized membrane protein